MIGAAWLLAAALAVVAFLYASVGHAGASGYIAVLALAGLPAEQIKPLALILNTLVASVGCWNFLRAGHLPWRRIWPVYLLAIPGAFLGGWLNLPSLWFRRLVGAVLLFSAWRLGRAPVDPPTLREPPRLLLLTAGGGLGLLAGLTGTGGGVFLTPLLGGGAAVGLAEVAGAGCVALAAQVRHLGMVPAAGACLAFFAVAVAPASPELV